MKRKADFWCSVFQNVFGEYQRGNDENVAKNGSIKKQGDLKASRSALQDPQAFYLIGKFYRKKDLDLAGTLREH